MNTEDTPTPHRALLKECDYARARRCVNACAGLADPAAELARLRADNERLASALSAIVEANKSYGDVIGGKLLRDALDALAAIKSKP